MITVGQWTGREVKLLQKVLNLSNREFRDAVGVSYGAVMKWRREEDIELYASSRRKLEAVLRERCTPEQQAAFAALLAANPDSRLSMPLLDAIPAPVHPAEPAEALEPAGPFAVTSHKFLPVYVGPRLRALWDAAHPTPAGPAGLERRMLPLPHPGADRSAMYLYACGIAVVHLDQPRQPATITELALWRYRTYVKDRAWVGHQLERLLNTHDPALAPEYVLSVYSLDSHSWTPAALPTAMQLLATPSVLVDRRDPANIRGLDPSTEQSMFAAGWEHPDAVEFSGAISMGLAGWSGIAYHPLPGERALTIAEIIDLELDVQALWALSTHIHNLIGTDPDPVMPKEAGRACISAAYARLTQSGPVETVQHRLMRKAILATSELPERLTEARDALST